MGWKARPRSGPDWPTRSTASLCHSLSFARRHFLFKSFVQPDTPFLFLSVAMGSTENPFLKALAQAKDSSPVAKRGKREDLDAPMASRSKVVALSPVELTRGYLDHDHQLRQLDASTMLVYKYEESAPFAQLLMSAVRVWQSQHHPGKPHPMGACSTAVATALFDVLRKDEKICPKPLADLLSSMLGGDLTVVAREIAVCTARLTAKRTHMLVELRPHLASPLLPYLPTVALFLHDRSGERLDVRPQGALARKALGKQRAS